MNGTPDSRNTQLDRLALTLVVFKQYVEIKNNAQLLDNNRLAESLIADLMSCLCGWGNFKNLNQETPHHRAIDLLSEDGTIGVQVTTTRTASKVRHTLEQFASLPDKPQRLYIMMVCGRLKNYAPDSIDRSIKQAGIKFDASTDILDLEMLFHLAKDNSQARIERLCSDWKKKWGNVRWPCLAVSTKMPTASYKWCRPTACEGRSSTNCSALTPGRRRPA
ncbi:SMEK domain-containing protein [Pseudomonas marginalis]|uniref:SMEK domain-containing protein n=1 Tax=Pseudomonas marginalis TaxID=298 RepID=UPI002A358714|nr:SMEK domain-containing protein [Pseudomonas marginalis]WPN25996.1 SMEK domain-containing protein [Pseudomonas marginalis]